MKILISGTSGLVGSHLVPFLSSKGHEIVSLVRSKEKEGVFWDPKRGEIDLEALEGFDAIIHLAGKNIGGGLWTKKFKALVFQSRCRDTWLLSQAILRLKRPPKTFIGASAAGIYGEGFLADLCKQWEKASQGLEGAKIRVIRTRFGLVLSEKGGVLARLKAVFKTGLGSVLGSGEQKVPWIAIEDVLRGMEHLLMREESNGPYAFVAPETVTMKQFCKAIADWVSRPLWLKIPAWILRLFGGQMAREMLLQSIEVGPEKLLKESFSFNFPTLESFFKQARDGS